MNIAIIGAGTVGEATGLGLAQMGYNVTFCDSDEAQLLKLTGQKVSLEIVKADIYFVCTHENAVEKVIQEIEGKHLEGLIVVRSTTPPGHIAKLSKQYDRHICHNPEFCRQETAFTDFIYPPRVVIGECCKEHGDILAEIYRCFDAPIIRTDTTTSELAKLACNAHLASLISYWNEIELLSRHLGTDYKAIQDIARKDPRISMYGTLSKGAFKGYCLPKDVNSLIATLDSFNEFDVFPVMLDAIKKRNDLIGDDNDTKD